MIHVGTREREKREKERREREQEPQALRNLGAYNIAGARAGARACVGAGMGEIESM